VSSRDAARQIQDLTAAATVLGGDRAADLTAAADPTAVLEQLHGSDWADQLTTPAQRGRGPRRTGPSPITSGAGDDGPHEAAVEAVGAWQNGAEAPRLAGMAQTTRAGRSSPPDQLRRGQRHSVEAARQRGPGLER